VLNFTNYLNSKNIVCEVNEFGRSNNKVVQNVFMSSDLMILLGVVTIETQTPMQIFKLQSLKKLKISH